MSDWLSIMRHTIGADQYGRIQHDRNYFITGEGGKDWLDCVALVSAGYMTSRKGNAITGGDDIFFATKAGREFVQINSEPMPEPQKRTRYQEYLDADGCAGDSFTEFLCGRQFPIFESRRTPRDQKGDRFGYQHRMYRLGKAMWCYDRDVEGEWCATMKEAKASYKVALRASKQRSL
jgi:hypothetical protein